MNPGYHRILGALRDLRTDWRWWLSFVLPVRMTSTYEVLRQSGGALDHRRGPVHVYDRQTDTCSCWSNADLPVTERATWWQWRGRVFARAVEVIDTTAHVVIKGDITPDEARRLGRAAALEFGEALHRQKGEG